MDLASEVFHDGDEHRVLQLRLPESAGVRDLFDVFCALFIEGCRRAGGAGPAALSHVRRKMRQVGVRCDYEPAAPLPPRPERGPAPPRRALRFCARFGGTMESSMLLLVGARLAGEAALGVRFTPEINTGPPRGWRPCGRHL